MKLGITAFIFARGGSKGLPNKNLMLLGGKPLIAWAIESALKVNIIEKVMVSTDSVEIAAVAKAYGADIPFMRPSNLATDESPEWKSWQHALNFVQCRTGYLPETFISVPTTSPLRNTEDINNCLNLYFEQKCDAVVTITESRRNPYFNMVSRSNDGSLKVVNQSASKIVRRQDAPITFDMATVCYVVNPNFIMNSNSLFEGKVLGVTIPYERAIDIDSLIDFEICELLLNKKADLT